MADLRPLNIFLASSELTPLAKTGGLADVSSALVQYIGGAGHDVRTLIPFYSGIDTRGLDIVPVDFLQNLTLQVGWRNVHYSVDAVTLPGNGTTVYLLRCPELYHRPNLYTHDGDEHIRFIFLSRAAIEVCQRMGFAPDIFHCHDWHTSLIPLYLKTVYAWDSLFARTRSVLTIHNIGYQGIFPSGIVADLDLQGAEGQLHQGDLAQGRVNFLRTGVLHAHLLTTVSPTYAREIMGNVYGMGMEDLLRQRHATVIGILNGVDYREWDPATDPLIPARYTSDDLSGKAQCKIELMRQMGLAQNPDRPLIGIVTRLAGQKGIDLLQQALPALLNRRDFALVALGSGEGRYEDFFEHLQQHFRGRVAYYRGYHNRLAHMIEAGSDMFLMPSRYEPCGLNQMYSLKYGTVPIVRETGGLADSVELVDANGNTGTGILFSSYNEAALSWAVNAALDLYGRPAVWRRIMRNGMAQDFSWERQAERYIDVFRALGRM